MPANAFTTGEFALPNADHSPRIVGNGETSLLEVMDGIAGAEGVEFEPERANIKLRVDEF